MASHLIYDPKYLSHDTDAHPENARRLQAILRVVGHDDDLTKKIVRSKPKPASHDDIVRCHREDQIFHIESACERGETYLDVDRRIRPASFKVAQLAAGAAVASVDAAVAEE